MQFYPEREQLLSSLLDSNGEEMAAICAGLADNFVCVYLNCDKGKEKYARFQVQWHQSCSKFLLPVDEHTTPSTISPPTQLWHTLTRSATQEVCNPLMISISSAIYGFLLQQVRALIKDDGREQCTYTLLGGGALADIFKQRYKDMKSKKTFSKQGKNFTGTSGFRVYEKS